MDLILKTDRDGAGQKQIEQEREKLLELERLARDITERERAERELRERVEEIEALMEAMPAVVLIAHDTACQVITGNRIAQESLRMPKGRNISKTAPEGQQPTHFKVLSNGAELLPHELPVQLAARGVEVRCNEHEVVFGDGERLHFYGNAVPLRDGAGNARGAISAFVDITERKRAEQEKDEAKALLETLLTKAPHGFLFLDADERCRLINDRMAEMIGMPVEAHVGKTMREIVPDLADKAEEVFRRVVETGEPVINQEFSGETPAAPGEIRYWNESWYPVRDHGGKLLGVGAIVEEITERKQVEESLRESERRFKMLADKIPALVWMDDEEGRGVFVNARYLEYTGLSEEEIRGGWPNLIHPDDAERYLADYREASERRAEHRSAGRLRRRDGVYRWFEAIGLPRFEGDRFAGYVGCNVDVHDREMAEESLREADRRKDEFLAMLAHELRNPLAPIRNAVHILNRLDLSDERLEWSRGVIERQVEHLTRLVDDLLDVSRITQGKITLRKEKLDLMTVVGRALETSRPLIDARKHQLTVSLPSESVRLKGDLLRLAQVVSNLLNNAAKYTDEGGAIWLTAETDGEEVMLRVKDNGMGIPAEELPHIFDLFIQAERSLDRAQGGLGIGLTLVRSIVELHGGRVEAFSDGPGQGSEFVARLPLLAHAPREALGASRVGRVGRDVKTTAPPVLSKRRRVLVVDDNVDSAESLAVMLTLEGHEAMVAHDGPSAIELARAFQPQVALLDIGLPRMNGYEVARLLRKLPGGREMTLIALTGYGQVEDKQRSREAGFDHHLTKPVNYDTLMSLINSMILR